MPLFEALLVKGLLSIINTIKAMSGHTFINFPLIKNNDKDLKTD